MGTRLPIFGSSDRACPDARVLLINPPQSYPKRLRDEYQSYFPVGIASLGAAVESTGAAIQLIDCLAFSDERSDGDLVWFGMDLAKLRTAIERFAPHIVGIANPFSMFIDDAVLVADLVKSIDSRIQVVVGGIEASIAPNNRRLLARSRSIDVLVKGEGELTLRDLVGHFSVEERRFTELPEVVGILFRDDSGDVVENDARPWIGDLDSLPMPAYHLLDVDQMYANPHYGRFRLRNWDTRCLPVHTSRGCPYSCNFCSVHSQVGKAHRRQSPSVIAKHIEHLKNAYGVTHIHFEDDNLTLNPKHTVELLGAIEPLGITFDTPNGIRADTIDAEVARRLKRAGATSITIAVESGVQAILDDVVEKRLDLEDVQIAASALDQADVPCLAFFIIGFPGESEKEVRGTLRFGIELTRAHATANLLFVANPLPGTPLFRQCEEHGYLVRELDKDALFAGIRITELSLIETGAFRKRDLYQWAREELDIPGLLTSGTTMPLFLADQERARRRASRFVGDVTTLAPFPWETGYRGG